MHTDMKSDCMFTNQGSVGSGMISLIYPPDTQTTLIYIYIEINIVILFYHALLASTGASFLKKFLDLYWECVAAAEKVGRKDTTEADV